MDLTTKTTKITKTTKEVRPFDGPPKAARRDGRERKYKPLWRRRRLLFALSYIASVGVLCTTTNRTAGIPFVFVSLFLL